MSPETIKHLEFIQNIITRMNTNSFQLKGACLVIVSSFLAIFASTKIELFFLAAIFPTLIFWFLDTYYLTQERKFRGLYDDVSGVTKKHKIKPFQMRPDLYKGKKYSYWRVFFSTTICTLYSTMIVVLIILFLFF